MNAPAARGPLRSRIGGDKILKEENMGRSPEDYERLHRPPSPFMRGYMRLYWGSLLVSGYAWILLGTSTVGIDTWDWLYTNVKIENWSWPLAIITLTVIWVIGVFMIWLSSKMLKSLSK